MERQKVRWIPLIVALIAIIGVFWYTRPVDIYGLGMDELKTINVLIEYAEPGQSANIVWNYGAAPNNEHWQTVLEELESLRFRRPIGNLLREYQPNYTNTQAMEENLAHTVIKLTDQADQHMMIQLSAGQPCYTSLHTSRNLPISLSGGENAAQALAERLQK